LFRFFDVRTRNSVYAGVKKASMTKKWIAIDLLLLAVSGLLGWQLRTAIIQFKSQNNVAKIQPAQDLKSKVLPEKQAQKAAAATEYNPADFSVVADRNLFSDSRSKEDRVENLAPPEPPPLTVKPILVGVTITDAERKASIIDPGGAPGVRRAQFKRIGDVFQGYTITEIQADRMVLTSGTRREVIPLREGSKKAAGGKTAILSTRVVPFGQGGITGGAPISISGASVATSPKSPVTPIGTSAPVAVPSAPVQGRAGAQTAQPIQPAVQPAAQPSSGGSSGATRVIRTPFGDIVRPVN
jgi:hypothetical protein